MKDARRKAVDARVKKAKEILFMNTPMEIIYETYSEPDFIEFHGSAGGDVMCYRVYNDGGIYAR